MARNLRSGQLLSPFGIGQIVNFPNEESLMICGLDNWDEIITTRKDEVGAAHVDESEFTIRERRLEKILGVEKFKTPWAFKKAGKMNTKLSIPAVRFPGWHYCSVCGFMNQISYDQKDVPECKQLRKGKDCNGKLVPMRFVAVCQLGHIQDVPFKEWVHAGPITDGNLHLLKYESGTGSGELASISISCSCGQRKSLAGLLNVRKAGNIVFDSALARVGHGDDEGTFSIENPNDNSTHGQYCLGHRPWLWPAGVKSARFCGAHLQVLIKGGSNVHYSEIVSALYLPEVEDKVNPLVLQLLNRFDNVAGNRTGLDHLRLMYHQDPNGNILKAVLQFQPEVLNAQISLDQLLKEVIAIIDDKEEEKSPGQDNGDNLRFEEYECILKGRNSENADFKALRKSFENYVNKEFLNEFFETVVLIERLKETRVFKGFSRINGTGFWPGNESSQNLTLGPVNWLPAAEVFGEGIFLQFRDDKIDEWVLNNKRYDSLFRRYNEVNNRRQMRYTDRDINPAFVLIHTFAHLLIKRLCFNCGYGSSSLREKIYFSGNANERMNGVLIYTSSGDSEGSMGGLVRQGTEEFLCKLIKDAIEDSRWCSADPVCSEIGQYSGQGPDNVNGSACHNCCILPETSCEEYNVLLDRSTLTGTLLNQETGFFN